MNNIKIPHKNSKNPNPFLSKKKTTLITMIRLPELLFCLFRKKSEERLIINFGIIIIDPKNEIIDTMLIH